MNDNPITVEVHYNESSVDIVEILNDSLWLFIKREVEKLCS